MKRSTPVAWALTSFFMSSPIAYACELEGIQHDFRSRALTLGTNEVCIAILSGISGQHGECVLGVGHGHEVLVEVTRQPGRDVVEFDIKMMARSSLLSGKAGGGGFERHKYKFLLFLDLNCRNTYWYYEYEPRYILGVPFSTASNEGNPNWKLFSDNDRIITLSERLDGWLRAKLEEPFASGTAHENQLR